MRQLKKEDFMGKKIIDCEAGTINSLILKFDDNTEIEIEVEYYGHNIYGMTTRNK
jgi:hypothetical protein